MRRRFLQCLWIVLPLLFLWGCNSEPFPGCCDATGLLDVPFQTTMKFDFRTGFRSGGGELPVFSLADVSTLLKSANASQRFDTGVIGGRVVSALTGQPLDAVTIEVRDKEGVMLAGSLFDTGLAGLICRRIINPAQLFYNSIGGVPDLFEFCNTTQAGGFTVFDVPPGEIFLWATRGGRGNARLEAFPTRVSVIGEMPVVPVVRPKIVLEGGVGDLGVNAVVPGARIFVLGLPQPPDLEHPSLCPFDPSGPLCLLGQVNSVFETPRPLVPSNGIFETRVEKSGFLPTLDTVDTDLSNLFVSTGFIGIEKSLFALSETRLASLAQEANTQFAGRGVVIGKVLAGSFGGINTQKNARVWVTGSDGRLLAVDQGTESFLSVIQGVDPTTIPGRVVYLNKTTTFPDPELCRDRDGDGRVGEDPGNSLDDDNDGAVDEDPTPCGTDAGGQYLVLNLPLGAAHVNVIAGDVTLEGLRDRVVSTLRVVLSDPSSVALRDLAVSSLPTQGTTTLPSFTAGLTGKVTEEDGVTGLSGATISALGVGVGLAVSNSGGSYTIPAGDPAETEPVLLATHLLAGSFSLLTVDAPAHVPTYQVVRTRGAETNLNLTALSSALVGSWAGQAGVTLDPSGGVIVGTLFDRSSGRAAEDVSLVARDRESQSIGEVFYFENGSVAPGRNATSQQGGFIIFNLPTSPTNGIVNVAPVSNDDTGNVLVPTFPGGVVLANPVITKAPPPFVAVSGVSRDLTGHPVPAVDFQILGKENNRFRSDGVGFFDHAQRFDSFSSFILRATKDTTFLPTRNYQLRTGLVDQAGVDLVIASRQELSDLALEAGVALDLTTAGILAGQVQVADLEPFEPFTFSDDLLPAPQVVITGFFNEDIHPDLAVANTGPRAQCGTGGTVAIFSGDGHGGLLPPPSPNPYCVGADPVDLAAGDFNRDGFSDMAVLNNAGLGSVSLLFGSRKGNFNPNGIPIDVGSTPRSLAAGDLNLDGFLDLVVSNTGSNDFSILLNRGSGAFDVTTSFLPGSAASVEGPLLLADLNLDERLDLAVALGSSGDCLGGPGAVRILTGTGTGDFLFLRDICVGAVPTALAIDEFNLDGRLDLAVARDDNHVSLFLGDGSGRFQEATDGPFPAGSGPADLIVGDIDLDGRRDLVVRDSQILLFFGNGDGTFSIGSPVNGSPATPTSFTVSDVNEDGRLDIAVTAHTPSPLLALLTGALNPVSGAGVAAADVEGTPMGQVCYLTSSGDHIDSCTPGAKTTTSGLFLIFNVPFSSDDSFKNLVTVKGTDGVSGTSIVRLEAPGTAIFTPVVVTPLPPHELSVTGVTIDPVGTDTGVFLPGVTIRVLGTPIETLSDRTARYQFTAGANSSFILELRRPPTSPPPPSTGLPPPGTPPPGSPPPP